MKVGSGLPDHERLVRLGVRLQEELHAGKQSRVVAGTVDGTAAAIKFTDARLSDREVQVERLRAVEQLATGTAEVAPPLRIDGELVRTIDDWSISATPFVHGRSLDVADTEDAELMGRTLAGLHAHLAMLPGSALPAVAALDVEPGWCEPTQRDGWQLLHGDFSETNTLRTSEGVRILDFDDCGYGPPIYDVANSLYMVMFDAEVSGRPERFATFEPSFLAGYAEITGVDADRKEIDAMIALRIAALVRWLDDLSTAPIGIRSSSPAWRRTLRAFADSHRR